MPHDKDEEGIADWAGAPEVTVIPKPPRKRRFLSAWTWESFFAYAYDPTLHMAVVVVEVLLIESIEPWRIKIGVAAGVLVLAWIVLVRLNVKREAVLG